MAQHQRYIFWLIFNFFLFQLFIFSKGACPSNYNIISSFEIAESICRSYNDVTIGKDDPTITTKIVLTLSNNAVMYPYDNTDFKCIANGVLNQTGSSMIEAPSGLTYFQNGCIFEMHDKSNYTTSGEAYFNNNSISVFYQESKFYIQGTIMGVASNATLTLTDNSVVYSKNTISVNSKGTFEMNTNSMAKASNFNVKNSSVLIKNNAHVNLNKQFKTEQTSSIKMIGNSQLNFIETYSTEPQFWITDSTIMVIENYVQIVLPKTADIKNSTLKMSGNSRITSETFKIEVNGTLEFFDQIESVNTIITDQKDVSNGLFEKLSTSNFECNNANIVVDKKSFISNSLTSTLTQCTIKNTKRSIRDIPILFTKSVLISSLTSTSTQEFDLMFTEELSPDVNMEGITKFTPPGAKSGYLIRFGTSQKVFCHLKAVNLLTNSRTYFEPYCPCEGSNCYITPLPSLDSIIIYETIKSEIQPEFRNTKFLKSIKTANEDVETESVGIQNIQMSFVKIVKPFIVSIPPQNTPIQLTINSLSKTVLFISKDSLTLNEVIYSAGISQNGVFKMVFGMKCESGTFDTNTQTCGESQTIKCYDQNCLNCSYGATECLRCPQDYSVVNGMCAKIENCLYQKFNLCIKCKENYIFKYPNCVPVGDCYLYNRDGTCNICNIQQKLILKEGVCQQVDPNSDANSVTSITSCIQGFRVSQYSCESCNDVITPLKSTFYCMSNVPTKCVPNYSITYTDLTTWSCTINEKCDSGNDENGRCANVIEKCSYITNGKCVECAKDYMLSNNKCQQNSNKLCEVSSSFDCLRCIDNYYFDSNTRSCLKCSPECKTCLSTATTCLSCYNETYLSDGTCKSNDNLVGICDKLSITGGCVICADKYYRSGFECFECSSKCATCQDKETCYTCAESFYMTINGDCLPFSQLEELCEEKVTQNGCAKCKNGYYRINGNECKKCNSNCFTCSIEKVCTSCYANHLLNENNICKNVSEVSNCVKIENSKCEKCVFWYTPSKNGMYCQEAPNWYLLVPLIVLVLVGLNVLIVLFLFLLRRLFRKMQKRNIEQNYTIFNMNTSNIQFLNLKNNICVSSRDIDLNTEYDEIPIDTEIRLLFCVGNIKTRKSPIQKIQFSTADVSDKFTITFSPEVVLLKSGYACEFELKFKANCTCSISSKIVIVSKDIKNNTEKYNDIDLKGITAQSSCLDYSELIEDAKIGEGSFGIVYKGFFRGNIVAIKKMKSYNFADGGNRLKEFENEVHMLDKFRCDFIVHFFGAVFIPTKICMVTELAEFGSLQDLINLTSKNPRKKFGKAEDEVSAAKYKKLLKISKILEYNSNYSKIKVGVHKQIVSNKISQNNQPTPSQHKTSIINTLTKTTEIETKNEVPNVLELKPQEQPNCLNQELLLSKDNSNNIEEECRVQTSVMKIDRKTIVSGFGNNFEKYPPLTITFPMKLRLKFLIDAAKGIEYLHNNGILHRDIKPDNILIVNLEDGIEVNAKLTDFGSSRNINMLMTNMTFTKGIGTPIYMAGELLKGQKYKKPADVYSFAITMFEIFIWGEAYPGDRFKYPWDIIDFVNKGNRIQKPGDLSDEQFHVVQRAWEDDPKERADVKEVLEKLEDLYEKFN
ncbi:protein serine/threonine kinase, putative [Entamoeba invadens IP1]|uniref:Protein serine/threonine kinase, putative n=1 Tax=Entamoeba invadens IP1 TaxID=370355 RepID=A0A0A1UAP1_ENTIV|nr:protein serine/threonine kinase, putative [Entamoeba invadens IP1]ELP92040.1 protein serine/threonine kinase, putative [Entamoeba invadens IP1]|eukprot:XP_004258811.1 protein serine/threonine kinase, putative [Entamoeba invadens IP1]